MVQVKTTDMDIDTLHINDLPNELLIHIFSMVDFDSLLAVSQVCVRWQELCLKPFVWDTTQPIVCVTNFFKICNKIVPYVCKYFKKIKLQYFKLYSHVWTYITHYCPNLTHLEISVSRIDSCILNEFSNLPHLKFLSFRNSLIAQNSQDVNGNYNYHLPIDKLKNLETLVLSQFSLTHNSLYSMLQCENLVNINMDRIKNVPENFLKVLLITKQSTLRSLHIYGDTLNDDIICSLSKCKVLQLLHIMSCKALSDSSLIHLRKLNQLKSLKLRHGQFSTNALLEYFSNNVFQNLTYLSLSRCVHVNMEVARSIKTSATNLQELSLYLCPFITVPDFKRSELVEMFNIELLLD